jgi:hypothetical protein
VTDEEDNVLQRLLAIAIAGLRDHATAPLPGTPPSATHYRARWRQAVGDTGIRR